MTDNVILRLYDDSWWLDTDFRRYFYWWN